MVLNLFYEEPDPDRWFPFDRLPRKFVRRVLRGPPRVGGQARVFANLRAGLDRLGVPYRVNDYRHARAHPTELACIVGKPVVLDKVAWKNPILFGAAVYSHPLTDPNLLNRLPVRRILVPGEWMRRMCEPYWGDRVCAWPVGIDTDSWRPATGVEKRYDFLLYDKVRWDHSQYESSLIAPIRAQLRHRGLSLTEIRYGHYREQDFAKALSQSKAMIFLCEHETQGIAYQEALSSGVPILAWDRGGFWQDPEFYPERVMYAPVSSVPLWDERCGIKFQNADEFPQRLDDFLQHHRMSMFDPRQFILDNITLEKAAEAYIQIVSDIQSEAG